MEEKKVLSLEELDTVAGGSVFDGGEIKLDCIIPGIYSPVIA